VFRGFFTNHAATIDRRVYALLCERFPAGQILLQNEGIFGTEICQTPINMAIEFKPIIVEQTYHTSVDKVWSAITDPEQMRKWFFPTMNAFEAKVGFETQFNVQSHENAYLHIWRVTEVQPRSKIIYNWKYGGYSGNSYVIWELAVENNLTRLKLTHEGIETFPQHIPDFTRESCIAGWRFFLSQRLKEFLEAPR
jgi:uncharacterized protein YndB with AHSA1/START domain